jgi:hypothetical protein
VIAGAPGALARQRDWLYLNMADWRMAATPYRRFQLFRWSRMARPISTRQEMPGVLQPARRVAPAIAIGAAGLGAVILAGAMVLWFHYGTAVFFEMIASGISACF